MAMPGIGGEFGQIKDTDTGKNSRWHLASLDFNSALRAGQIIESIEKLNTRFWTSQELWRGTVAGMQAAGASTKNDPAAYRKGFVEGAKGVLTDDESNSGAQKGSSKTESTNEAESRLWERDIDDDF